MEIVWFLSLKVNLGHFMNKELIDIVFELMKIAKSFLVKYFYHMLALTEVKLVAKILLLY